MFRDVLDKRRHKDIYITRTEKSAMMRIKTLKSRIKLTEAALVKLKERYERKSRELLAMKKELQTAQAAEILSALRKSGRSYEELMTFLKG